MYKESHTNKVSSSPTVTLNAAINLSTWKKPLHTSDNPFEIPYSILNAEGTDAQNAVNQ